MRERTPSADDTPKRAPPAPTREAVSADVAGSGETPSDNAVEDYRAAKLPVSETAVLSDRMVASTQSLDDPGVNHPTSASNGDRQQQQHQQERYAYRSSQSTQDKRSRLSNVINNLLKKVPDGTARNTAASNSPRKEEDERNSVERNLENLEKYVMTVLNDVINDDEEQEDKDDAVGEKADKLESEKKSRRKEISENSADTAVKSEPSSEGDIEAAVVPRLDDSSMFSLSEIENIESSTETADRSDAKGTPEKSVEEVKIDRESKQLPRETDERRLDVDEKKSSTSNGSGDSCDASTERKESRTLGTIIMDRLSEHQLEERANVDDGRGDRCGEHFSENVAVRAICAELLEDVLNVVERTIDEKKDQTAEKLERPKKVGASESRAEETKDSKPQEFVPSLHCSLPLEKIASVLQNCQMSELVALRISSGSSGSPPSSTSSTTSVTTQKSSSKPSSCASPTRLLCLYCDKKFLSVSLWQRHTERMHQLGGGRRSERNPRKPSQNCQYCSEKFADTLEALFHHMVDSHADKYHACVQCSTRYSTREALTGHMDEIHGNNAERASQVQPEKVKENSPCKEFCNQNFRERGYMLIKERRSEEIESENQDDSRSDNGRTKIVTRGSIDNVVNPEFDSLFYSNVSCNIRENLLHHLDGKLQTISGTLSTHASVTTASVTTTTTTTTTTESKPQQQQHQQSQQSCYEHNVNQIQLPIDISLTAATPVYSKDYAAEEHENSSEYAQKASRISSGSRPRRVSFEKYNFPRKYDGREQWTCSIKDLSNFDISTQLLLRKKQQLIKERLSIDKLHQTSVLPLGETTEVSLHDKTQDKPIVETTITNNQDSVDGDNGVEVTSNTVHCDFGELPKSEIKQETTTESSTTTELSTTTPSSSSPTISTTIITEFSVEFADFMRLRKWEQNGNETANGQEAIHAELSGEWSRPRIYICGACAFRYVTLKEMEDHKAAIHPHVLCSHFELAGDQREYYKHLYMPGRNAPIDEMRDDPALMEMMCTKCVKSCHGAGELHRHMLECGGDHAWLLGLTGSGKKKCKWRPFGSRSRRRRQRGMKRNIQNSQSSPRITTPKEKQQPVGPRVRPSDRESIQKMLANLPPKRATRKILQDNAMRSQGRLRNVQTKTRSRLINDNTASRILRNKAALRNKLLKNAKSIQRNRCRSDNISAVIESVVRNYHENEKKKSNDDASNENTEAEGGNKDKDVKEISDSSSKFNKAFELNDKPVRSKVMGRRFRVLSRKRNMRTRMSSIGNSRLQGRNSNKLANFKTRNKSMKFKSTITSQTKTNANSEEISTPKITPKNAKVATKTADKDDAVNDSKKASTIIDKGKLALISSKRKRTIDPAASLNASIKAKSQLRTQDGKFARNPNKTKNLSAKSLEAKADGSKHKAADPIEINLRSKTLQKSTKKAEVQSSRRVTRLSSDSDKMPTLEPAVLNSSSEEYVDKSANDLPILSPVTSSVSQEQKLSRTVAKCVTMSKTKTNDTEIDLGTVSEKVVKEQKQTRGRKPKEVTKDTAKRKEIDNEVNEASSSKNNSKALKDGRVRKGQSLPTKNTNSSEEEVDKEEAIGKKNSKTKKEDATKETRSSSKARLEKDPANLSDIPFEVKKLLGSASKEDLLNTLELASNDNGSKRSLRQSRALQANDKSPRELDNQSDSLKSSTKRDKTEAIRKSTRRSGEKKNDDKLKASVGKDAAHNVAQNERAQGKKDGRGAKTKEIAIDSCDIEGKIDAKQTRVSVMDTKSESASEFKNDKKRNGLSGKRRGRNKSIDEIDETATCVTEEQSSVENVTPSVREVEKKKEIEEIIDKIANIETEDDDDSNSNDHPDSMVNLNLSHLQSETSNSVDSGKENTLEISVNTHKLKGARSRKTWGARRDKSSRKRSLSNVIGILTEGMNIPVEAQQSVVLTVQTSLDNDPDRMARNSVAQQPTGESTVESFRELVLARSDESSENTVVTANSTVNHQHVEDVEKNGSSYDKAQNDESTFASQTVDVSSKGTSAKAHSPTNDIILDLSRRKSKGKGSFLEKIVSKIAKQKDALLEGEVGSLLDTAADELTSILDEVGPGLIDGAENEVNHTSKNDDDKNLTDTSIDKEPAAIIVPETRSSEDDKINVDSVISELSTNLTEIQDNRDETLAKKDNTQDENQIRITNASDTEMKNVNIVNEQTANNAVHSTDEAMIESCDNNKLAMGEETSSASMEIPNEMPSLMIDNSMEISNLSDTIRKVNLEKVEEKESSRRSRRKSSKRSLENASTPKKNKKRSIEIVEEHTEEDIPQEELRLDDIFALIRKSEDASNIENKLSEKNDATLETLIGDAEVEAIRNSKSKTVNDNLEPSSSENNHVEGYDGSSLETSIDLPAAACKNVEKVTTDCEEPVNKITLNQETVDADVQSVELIEKHADSLTPSLEKNVKKGKFQEKADQSDTKELSSRRMSKRKSRSALSPAILPVDVITSVPPTVTKPIFEANDTSASSSIAREQYAESINEQSIKISTISEDPVSVESSPSQVKIVSKEHKEAPDDSSSLAKSMPPKTTKKLNGKRKKSLADEHLDLPDDELVDISAKLNEGTDNVVSSNNERFSDSLEHFKVPEVTDVLQSSKKRGSKRRSLPEDWNGGSVPEESRVNDKPAEVNETLGSVDKSEEQRKTNTQKDSNVKKLERSSSSDSIGLTAFVKTRSATRKQLLSNEDLVDSALRSQGTESTDDLSESSCTSEFSYFQKKRLVKKKKKEKEDTTDDDNVDSSVMNPKSSKSDKHKSKKMSKTKSLLDEHLELLDTDTDNIDVPMDIKASLENKKALENIEKEIELAGKSSELQNECAKNETTNDSANSEPDDLTLKESASSNYNFPDDPVASKKRAAGNFVVVHTKTGEILIVEKRKKLTKEAAKFFCDVCATSFTRKSSLKKHTLSQSHLSQMAKSTKTDKIESVDELLENAEEINHDQKDNRVSDQQAKSIPKETQFQSFSENSLEPNKSYSVYTTSVKSPNSLVDSRMMRQQALEDELLDEEICKITENMSHDEYVLTDHVSPEQPEASSTPIKKPMQQKAEENSTRRKHGNKKTRNKSKKRNLADEHLLLDSPEPVKSRVDSDEIPNQIDNTAEISSISCECSQTKEITKAIELTEDIFEETRTNYAEMKKMEMDSTVKSSREEMKSSMCEDDMKTEEHTESMRTTRSTLRKLSKIYGEGKEETQTPDNNKASNRFDLRPRRSKKFQDYEESDVDMYFMDNSIEINSDETDNNRDAQRGLNKAEEETGKNSLSETVEPCNKEHVDVENKNTDNAKDSKAELIVDSKKAGKKRGRPKVKDRSVSNPRASSSRAEHEITDNAEESKVEDQKPSSPIEEHSEEIDKPSLCVDTNAQLSKSRRGRPRKGVQVASKSPVRITVDSSVCVSTSNEMKEQEEEVPRFETTVEKIASTDLKISLDPDTETSPVVDHTRESNLSETEKDRFEQDKIRLEQSTFEDHAAQKIELTNSHVVFEKNHHVISSDKDNVTLSDHTEYTSADKFNCDEVDVNASNNSVNELSVQLLSRNTEEVQRDALKVLIAIDVSESIELKITDDKDSEAQNLSDVSGSAKKQQQKLEEFREEKICKPSEEEAKQLSSESRGNEDKVLIVKNASFNVENSNSHELLSHKTIDDNIGNKITTRMEAPSKKVPKGSHSVNKRENNRKKSKASKTPRSKSKKVATTKIAELSSDSENEDRTESASSSKSKIVKSVFGRVFGGEKADKVKEVLNDWVSRSEDDSDVSRNLSEAKSCLHGSTKIPDNGLKKDKKRHSSSDTKKDTERSIKKKGTDKNDSVDVHGKSKSRKKRQRNSDSMSESHNESLVSVNSNKRKRRDSKIKADEKLLRTFDQESPILSDGYKNMDEVKEMRKSKDQFEDGNFSDDKYEKSEMYHKENWIRTMEKKLSIPDVKWENLLIEYDAHGKPKNSSHKKRDARNERSSSPSQFNVFKCKRRESKTRAGEKIWRAFDNDTLSHHSNNDQNLHKPRETSKERETYESKDTDLPNDSKNVKRKDCDIWKNTKDQEEIKAGSGRGKSKQDLKGRKKQDVETTKNRVSKAKTNEKISKSFDNGVLISKKNQEKKNDTQDNRTVRSSESRNRSKNLTTVKDNDREFHRYRESITSKYLAQGQGNLPAELDHQSKVITEKTSSRKNKKARTNEDWKHSGVKNLIAFDQEELAIDNRPLEKSVARNDDDPTVSPRNCNSFAIERETARNQSANFDGNSHTIRESDEDDEDDNDEEEEEDNDLERRRMSPFYARESSMDSSSNNEENEEEEEKAGRAMHEDSSRKTNPNEFSGEKIVIRSPSSGHRSDVVTIAPTDAIEDNALDVPREIDSTTEPRQGKILNFDEELFVECCSRLKATSENELRGAKKIKLDHTESYHRRDDQPQGFRVNRDRWRDVESQNSLGSLLESVNQLLGEEMYSSHERGYRTRDSEQSSRSASPDASRADNLGYEDSLDVAFEHNNKLRDKIQQRMRESENLIANTFGQRTNDDEQSRIDKRDEVGNSYSSSIHEHERLSISGASNREQESPGHKTKVNSLSGLLLNLLNSNGKHDHNGSASMKLLAELACARAPTSTSIEDVTTTGRSHQSVKMVAAAMAAASVAAAAVKDSASDSSKKSAKNTTATPRNSPKKARNPIKELFERKKEINDRKDQQRSKMTASELNNGQKQRKSKKSKKQQQQQEFSLIRRDDLYSGMAEKKKRRDSLDRKAESLSERIKDVYEFDDEESQTAPALGSVMSYRNQTDKNYEIGWSKAKNIEEDLGATLENGKASYITDVKLSSIIGRKFLEKFAPKTKGALKSFQSEEQQQRVIESINGPMDEFIERKQRSKRLTEHGLKYSKLKKRGKSSKKRARNAWYENDSSDEFRTAAKAEDVGVGVGISKSQRACSKGKQNLFAELSTSSESEYEQQIDVDCEIANEQQLSRLKKNSKKSLDDADHDGPTNESRFVSESPIANEWRDREATIVEDDIKKDRDTAKSESEMSDHSLVIDERKTTDETRNSDDDADNQYERAFELDDLYREDSSDTETEVEEKGSVAPMIDVAKNTIETEMLDKSANLHTETTFTSAKNDFAPDNELIPLEEALDLLDQHDNLDLKSENVRAKVAQTVNLKPINGIIDTVGETSNDGINEETENKCFSPTEMRDEKEEADDDLLTLPEKLSSNEKPQKESENLPLHVFLSRKVQESKKRKQQQLDKLREEQERILMDFQPTRRQRKCAIGKQGLLAEISSSDEELYARDSGKRSNDKLEHAIDKSRKKRESKEKRKERYIEKKHEQMIAKEQKAIEEEILREVGKRKEILAHSTDDTASSNADNVATEIKAVSGQAGQKKKHHQMKEKQKKTGDEKNAKENAEHTTSQSLPVSSLENNLDKSDRVLSTTEGTANESNGRLSSSSKRKKCSKSPASSRKISKNGNAANSSASKQKSKQPTAERSKNRVTTSAGNNKDSKERKSFSGKRDSDDEELKTTKSWNKVEEGVGVAIGRRKRTAALQLYYWSSSSDEEEPEPEPIVAAEEEEEDDRQEQHGWIVGDSHKRMITMLAMEKQLKEKRRRSDDEFEAGKAKNKKHRNSTS